MQTRVGYAAEHVPVWTVWVFTSALMYQIMHSLEHIIQMYQHFFYKIISLHSHGALFYLDLEWNHFVFNSLYVLALWSAFYFGGWYRRDMRRAYPWAANLLLIGCIIETWHVTEHSFRIYQHMLSGCEPCLGILGNAANLIYLHGTYNILSLLFPLAAYCIGKYYLRMWRSL